eukprot:jgi/Psemu1/239230/estExt_Genewise1.C_1300044
MFKCVQENWIQLVLYSSSFKENSTSYLNVALTRQAFDGCRTLPFVQSNRQHKKYEGANCLQNVIKGLFGISKAAPVFSKDKSIDTISAKDVYNLVDNKNIQQYEKEKNKKPLTLKFQGLIPTLRPYQALAVQWMLAREHMTNHGEEWKVVWLVLDPKSGKIANLTQTKDDKSICTRGIYYCPFNGWIARSIKEAKEMTLLGRTHAIKGGILADQMGLGKTVEVLACILAHPLPVVLEKEDKETPCPRPLLLGDNCIDSTSNGQNKMKMARVVEVDLDRQNSTCTKNNVLGDKDADPILTLTSTPFNTESPMRLDKATANLAPSGEAMVNSGERLIDTMEIGSCICGDVISFTSRPQTSLIAFCDNCEEPMHVECTLLDSMVVAKLPRLTLRRTFGTEALECIRCKDCPCCLMKETPIRSRATLIICPPSILDQWEREIKRHSQQMKVLVYDGVERASKRARRHADATKLLHPEYLADADIILVSFVALMSDLAHSEDNRFISQNNDGSWLSSNLRRRKKYRVVPSPLLSILFWRVCIDEAQRVEVTTTKAAKMAVKLKGVHFWAVSGTPVGHGKLQDLYGLFLFLRLAPFDDRDFFNSCLGSTIDGFDVRLQFLLHNIFWRSTKALDIVKKQIGIPEMKEERVVLKFSSIERHFYDRQLQKTLQLADDSKVVSLGKGKRTSTRFDFLSESLHRLRAACCHPQVGSSGISGGRRTKSRKMSSGSRKEGGNSVASRVMTMEQILDRFIDDARHKCEEAQRIAILHTNGMAGLTRLKIEARARGVKIDQNDRSLLLRSGQLYRESLLLAQKNANPVRATAEAKLTGNIGFCSQGQVFQNGKCFPTWKMEQDFEKVWTTIEYENSRRIVKLLIRPILHLPLHIREENSADFEWKLIKPTSIMLQVATAATGGEFVDCTESSLKDDWVEIDNVCRTNKSKSWRIVVTMNSSDYCNDEKNASSSKQRGFFLGLQIQLFEPQINSDGLQLLHSLHNACLSYEGAIKIPSEESNDDTSIRDQIKAMKKQIAQIESIHKEQAVTLHKACMFKLDELTTRRKQKEERLHGVTSLSKFSRDDDDCWDDGWYDDFLGMVSLYGSDIQQNTIFDRIVQDVEGLYNADETMKFPDFNNVSGLRTALNMRIHKIRSEGIGKRQVTLPATTADNEFVQVRSARFKCSKGEHHICMESIHNLSSSPSLIEINENSHCRLCKADWNQTGKICRHCDIASILQDLKPDPVTIAVLTAIYAAIRTSTGMSLLNSKEATHVAERAKLFFEVLEAEEREKVGAWRMWRIHLDLLNGLDELDSCKKGLRLSLESEDLTLYTEEQLNAIVQPIDVLHQYHDHAAKQAMSLGDLRQSTGTLRYLQNQKRLVDNEQASTTESCVVCLQPLDGECSVLRCGHRFHQKPCFEQILKNSGGLSVHCPMKCRLRTAKNEVMIATNKARDDGSNTARKVKGSYGTKITRIVSDILCIKDKGEKGVIFSQWNDMLDILESALMENNIVVARPFGNNGFSRSLLAFHSQDCTVLLLNLKQGAEGLTLVKATHVFMVEPIMNNGLDQQAINRIHRIGQTRRTFVWRYLIENTIEMKLDRMRQKHQEDNEVLEDSINSTKLNSAFSAGGIDGGFASQAELLEILEGN